MQGTTTNQGADQTLTPKAQRWCGCGPWGGGYHRQDCGFSRLDVVGLDPSGGCGVPMGWRLPRGRSNTARPDRPRPGPAYSARKYRTGPVPAAIGV